MTGNSRIETRREQQNERPLAGGSQAYGNIGLWMRLWLYWRRFRLQPHVRQSKSEQRENWPLR